MSIGYFIFLKYFKYKNITCVTQKEALFQYVIRVYPIDIQKTRAGLLPPLFRTIYEQQLN